MSTTVPWLDERASRTQAELQLASANIGAFVVRRASARPDSLVVSHRTASGVAHSLVRCKSGKVAWQAQPQQTYDSFAALIADHALDPHAADALHAASVGGARASGDQLLNDGLAENTQRSAQAIGEDLLRRILDIYQRWAGVVNARGSATVVRADAEFEAFESATAELKQTLVRALNDEQRLAFFINVYHTLLLHAAAYALPDTSKDASKKVRCIL